MNMVINFEVLTTAAAYVYRVGRIGRVGNFGIVIMFVVLLEE